MNIIKKIKFDFTTYFIILGSLFCGWFSNIILILLIIIIHELGHVFFLKLFHFPIIEIKLYPFGGITKTKLLINTNPSKNILIAFGGIIFQIILFMLFYLSYHFHLIRYYIYHLFILYNTSIIFFNLIPIVPLDGSIILKSFLTKIFSYKISNIITLIISIIGIIIYLSFNYLYKINNYLISLVLIYKTINFSKNIAYEQNLLYLERYLYKFKFNKIKYISQKDKFKLNTYHYIKNQDIYIPEEDFLHKLFSMLDRID